MKMKKIFQNSFAALAGLVLASCNGNYDDWAKPQSYNQENPAAAYGVTLSPGSVTMYLASPNTYAPYLCANSWGSPPVAVGRYLRLIYSSTAGSMTGV